MTAACSGANSGANEAVRKDFRRYLAQLTQVTDIEVAANDANKAAVEAPNANDSTYSLALREMIVPKYEEFEREIANIHPATNEILGLHNILLKRSRGF